MKTTSRLLVLALLAAGTMFAQVRFSIGIGGGDGLGYYPPPPVYREYVPVAPGPGYTWIAGYWAPGYTRNVWVGGYWRAPIRGYYAAPYAPRYYNTYRGYDRHNHRGKGHYKGYRY